MFIAKGDHMGYNRTMNAPFDNPFLRAKLINYLAGKAIEPSVLYDLIDIISPYTNSPRVTQTVTYNFNK